MHASSPPNAFTYTPASSNNHHLLRHRQPTTIAWTRPFLHCRHHWRGMFTCFTLLSLIVDRFRSLEFRQSLQLDVDTVQSTTTAPKPEPLESQVPPEALAQLTMSSSPNPVKRVASGDGISEKKVSDVLLDSGAWRTLSNGSAPKSKSLAKSGPIYSVTATTRTRIRMR